MTGRLFDLVLFDLGGVLLELRGVESMRTLAGMATDEELWSRWLTCRWVRSFERGACSPEVFAAGVTSDWQLAVTPSDFLATFRDWPVGPLPGAHALVETVRDAVPVGCLSNTNVLHTEEHFSRWPIFDAFDHRLLSFELGMLKPDRVLFEHVAQLVGVEPARILFLDDNVMNVEGAGAAGFIAVHARGVAEVEDALTAAGVLGG